MRHVAAYMLLVLGGNEKPTAADITKVLESASVEADEAQLEKLVEEMGKVELSKVLEDGLAKLANVAAASGGGGGGGGGAAAEEKKEEEEEEEEEESAGGAGGLFDDDDDDW